MSFQEAIARFLVATHDSKAARVTADLLQTSQKYTMENRNRAVEALAKDVESQIGMSANLMFRSNGAIHDALQELMDAYIDDADARDAKSHA